MAGELFGTPAGFRLYDADQADLAKSAAETAHQRALTRLNDAQARTMTRKADQDERRLDALSQAMGTSGTGGPSEGPSFDDLTAGLRKAASVYASLGELDQASKLVDKAAGVQQKLAGAEASKALEQARSVRTDIAKLRLVQETLSGVTDSKSHAQAVLALQSNPLTADEPLPAALRNYEPNALRAFLAGSPAAIKKREEQLKTIEQGRKERDSVSRRSVDDIRKEVMERRVAVSEAREERIAKTGGVTDKGPGSPNSSEVKAMRQEIKRLGLDAGDDTASIQAQTLAEEARILVKRNPGLSLSEARARVIAESAARGELEQPSLGGVTIPLSSKAFVPKDGALARPLALPASRDALKAGSYYRAKNGEIRKFTGEGWESVAPASKVPQMSSVLADEDEDDDGEEE